MSTVVFVGQTITDRRLLTETHYRYYPSSELKEQIIKDLEKHIGNPISEEVIIDLNVAITLKAYDLKYQPIDKNQCYQESLNTKTGE